MTLNVARRPGVAVLLSVLCLAFAAIIYYELGMAGDKTPAAPPPVAAGTVPPPLPPQPASSTLPPIENFAEVTRRPLFSPTRQPAPEAVKETQVNPDNFALIGIIIAAGGKIALIEYGRPPALAHLKEGQAVEGWTLQSILPDRVVLQRCATEQALKLRDRSGQPAQPKQPGPAPPPTRPGRG